MILHRHHLSTLRSLRRQHWIKWLQITTVFLWSLFPPFYTPAPAAYTPDSQSPPHPVWDGNGDEPESGPDLSDDDSDGLPNWFEQWLGSDVGNPDTDYDGLSDADEQYLTGTDPINWDSDNDGYSDHDAYYSCWAVNHNAVGFGQSVYDWDGDGIYNPQDAWPLDANNGSYDPSTYDSDGDGYADANDSHPYDYSVWGDWGTGDEPSGEPDSGEGDPEPADDDSDDDGFPDGQDSDPMDSSLWDDANRNGINDSAEVDPYSNDADNDTIVDAHDSHPWDSSLWSDWNSNNQNDEDETGNSGGDPPAEDPVDSDGDGIVDAYDSHPSDSALYSDWNFNSQNDHEENSGGGDPPEDHADSDGDTVLDPNDSHPNNSSLWNDFNGNNINDDDNDPLVLNSDEDEVVDALDSHPFDSALWNDFNHNGINDHDGDPMFQDSDSDGVPDATDSHPDNLDLWNDHNDNGVNDEEPDEDQDGDGVINFEDSHPKNPSIWSDWDFDALNHEAEITHQTDPNHPDSDRDGLTDGEEVSHGTSPLYTDSDGDGLPDFPELRGHYGSSASDAFSLSKKKGWGSLYHDGQIVDTTDSDRDGIPNSIEELYGLSPSNPADALSDLDGDGITNLAAFRQGKSLCGVVSPLDRDGDGLTDAQEDYWGRNGGVYLSKFNPNDAVEDPDNDDLMNWQEIALGSHPGSLTSMGAAFDLNCGDGTVAFWQALILPSSPDHARALARLPAQYHALIPTWADQTMQTSYDSETDQTWVSGPALGLQAFLSDVPPADRGPGRNAPGDYDGDSMPDRWEWRYRQKLNLLDPADAGTPNQAPTLKQDPDSDALSNLAEFQLNTHPLLPDTDGDGFSDGLEIQHGTNPTQSTSLPPITLSLVSGNSQTTLVDTIAAQPLTIATRRITTPVPGTPVTFTVTSLNGGKLSTNPAGPWQPAVTVLSSISGVAQVYWNAPLSPSSASVVASSAATSASSLTFDLTATPTNPNNPNNPNNPTDPANPANPSTFHVFTAHRTKTASFSGSEGSYCKQEIVEDPIIEDGLYSISEIRPTHDGFDGNADIAENPVDDGDPRDLNLLHLYIQNPILTHFVPPDTPGAVAVQPFPSTLYTPTDVYSRVTSPPKGYYQADDAFIATSPVTGENNSSTYNPETLTTMLSTVPWAPSVQDGWMGNGRRGISTYSASASWTHYSWSAPCGNPSPEPPEDPTTNPEGDDYCGSSGSSGGGTVTTVGMSGTTAAANHTQVRLQSSHTVNDPAGLSRTFLLLQKRTNFTPQGDISDDPIITSLGTATLTIPQGQKISTQVSGTASLTHLRIEGGIAYIELAPPPSIPNTRIELDLLPVEFKKLWETKNKANQIVVKAKRDDPKDDKQTADPDGNLYGTPRYLLYVTADPTDSKYHVSLDCELGGMRDQFVCAAYDGSTKVSDTDKAFPAAADQPAELLIPATGSSQRGQDFVIKVAFDANKNGLIDASEPLIDLTAAKSETGSPAPPMIRGFSMGAVDAAKTTIHGQATGSGFTGWKPNFLGEWFVPNAQALERLFYDGAIGGMVQDYQPTTTLGPANLNAFGPPGDFNEWLTHHAGSNFNADGVTTVQHYYWNPSKRISNLIATSSPLSLLKSNSTITSQITSVTDATVENFKQPSVPVGQTQTFPSGAAGYDLQPVLAGLGAPHSSPAWVPKQTLLVGDQDGYAGAIPDDAFGTVGRSRFINGEYRFIVKKEPRVEHFSTGDPGGYDIPYTAVVVYLRVSGSSQDLYDFNHNGGGLSIPAAITQLSYGNGGYGRTNGVIFRATVDILKDYEVKEIRLP